MFKKFFKKKGGFLPIKIRGMVGNKIPNGKILAQSATELAIFGAILMFVIGLIIRTGLYQGHTLNAQLRTMRLALTESYKTAHGYYRTHGHRGQPAGARNTASIMMVEDRISIDSAQSLGTRDRIPIIASGSGTMSHNLFWSLDYGNQDDLPMFDLYVNGQRFPLTTARFMKASIRYGVGGYATIDYHFANGEFKGSAVVDFYCGDADRAIMTQRPLCWVDKCIKRQPGEGCIIAFTRVYNVPPPAGEEWCTGVTPAGGGVPCPPGVIVDERFDLDHNGRIRLPQNYSPGDVPYGEPLPVPKSGYTLPDGKRYLREVFNWQWVRVALTQPRSKISNMLSTANRFTNGVDIDNSINRSVDLDGILGEDGDLLEEYILEIDNYGGDSSSGWIRDALSRSLKKQLTHIRYIDYQEGDVDFSQENVGLKTRVSMYSETHGEIGSTETLYAGTYMLVEEGKLYGANGQFIRDTTRQDHVDIISREFQISHNTGRFCTSGPNPRVVPWGGAVYGVATLQNPVEACGFTSEGGTSTCVSAYTNRTCLDVDTHMLYIRSRIDDLRGSRWLTRVMKGE